MIHWYHATNDTSRVHAAVESLAAFTSENASIVGIECDLRCCANGRVVLCHDPVTEQDGIDHLLDARSIITSVIHAMEDNKFAKCVLKLDFKDGKSIAAIASSADDWLGTVRLIGPRLSIWGNADLVQCQFTQTNEFQAVFPDPPGSGELLVGMSNVLSVGFHRPGHCLECYDNCDVDDMVGFLSQVHERVTIHDVTLALRLSLAQQEAGSRAVSSMIFRASSALGAQNVFVTFWRGRAESIGDQDVAWALSTFPGATVDRD